MSETTTVPEKNYDVPGEPGLYYCARHPKVTTRLRCGRCETPICPKCTVMGPTGARCPSCSSNRGLHYYQIKPAQYAAAVAVSVLLGIVSGWLAGQFSFGFFTFFYAPVVGTLLGKAVSAASGQKRGMPLALIASGGVILGALLPVAEFLLVMIARSQVMPGLGPEFPSATAHLGSFSIWLYLALAIPSLWYWLK